MLRRDTLYSFAGGLVFIILLGFTPFNQTKQSDFPERVKIALREVGNQLLLAQNDSVSRVLPIIEKENNIYEVSFETSLEILPDDLLDLIKETFTKSNLPHHYRVEVLQCIDNEVAYSYVMKNLTEESIIPCRGRTLPNQCYTVKVHFIESTMRKTDEAGSGILNQPSLLYILLFVALVPVSVLVLKKKQNPHQELDENSTEIGEYTFFPEQHLLMHTIEKTTLSKKECELLIIFSERINQTVSREELTKKVWEDHGVIVGRSLDTYISKLRKKLKSDTNIQISNVHGIGYKLEVN